ATVRAGASAAAGFCRVWPLEREAVTLTRLSGVLPRTSIRPPCLRKAWMSAAIVSLVRLRPTSWPLAGRADRWEVVLRLVVALVALRGMSSPLLVRLWLRLLQCAPARCAGDPGGRAAGTIGGFFRPGRRAREAAARAGGGSGWKEVR